VLHRALLYAIAISLVSFLSWSQRRDTVHHQDVEQWLAPPRRRGDNATAHAELEQRILNLEAKLYLLQQSSGTRDGTNNATTTTTSGAANTKSASADFPSCRSLMQIPNSPLANGDFLTQSPVVWRPRHDGSRELDLQVCRLHRYTSREANQCLAGQHLNLIGDSLTRYQFLSLAQFIHTGSYPAHFPRANSRNPYLFSADSGTTGASSPSCRYVDSHGVPQCSPPDQPNLCSEGDFGLGLREAGQSDSWHWLHGSVGGSTDGGIFDGHMECSCARHNSMQCHGANLKDKECATENELYVGPPVKGGADRVILSNVQENGWGANPVPTKGFNFTGCAWEGSCRRPENVTKHFVERAEAGDFDFFEPLPQALAKDGALQRLLPPANITIYNRGLWGLLTKEKSDTLFPLLYDFAGGREGRCFYRTTTASPRSEKTNPAEQGFIRRSVFEAGCSFLDFAHVTQEFAKLHYQGKPGLRKYQTVSGRQLSNVMERSAIYWDEVHFMPWVYEELNNLLLNVLCNHRHDLPADDDEAAIPQYMRKSGEANEGDGRGTHSS